MGGYYEYTAAADAASMLGGVAIILLMYLLAFGLCIAMYVLQSLGLYTIAGRRGIKNPWLSWLPAGNMWMLGTIADQYRYVAKGQERNRRKVILGLSIAMAAMTVVIFAVYIGWFVNIMINITQLDYMPEEQMWEIVLGPILAALGVCLVMELVAIVLLVFEYIALNDLYRSCDPSNAVVFLVLSIIFPVTMPFLVFACRKKDLGMPPRKDAVPVLPVEPDVQ